MQNLINTCIGEIKVNMLSLTTLSLNKCACIDVHCSNFCYYLFSGHKTPGGATALAVLSSFTAASSLRFQAMPFQPEVCSAFGGKNRGWGCRAHTDTSPAVLFSEKHLLCLRARQPKVQERQFFVQLLL